MTLLEKIFLVCGVSIILFPIVVVTVVMIMDAIFEYFDDKWVEGRVGGNSLAGNL